MTINGVVTINNGDIILNGLTFSENVTNLIPASSWVNSPTGSTMEDGNIEYLQGNKQIEIDIEKLKNTPCFLISSILSNISFLKI